MESFYFQLACLIAGIVLIGFWIYKSKKQVTELSEELLDKQIVINELAEHASRIEKESSSVVSIKPIKTDKKEKKAKKEPKVRQKQTKKTVASKKKSTTK